MAHGDAGRHLPARSAKLLVVTPFKVIDFENEASEKGGIDWWLELTGQGGEGMVVKPHAVRCQRSEGARPACGEMSGPGVPENHLRPGVHFPENLSRLRKRGLAAKRSLALREFALGVESLERFVRREPLRRVHECVFGVLALESEPVDPRL